MSRIGREPITIPAGVEVTVGAENLVTVKGALGTLTEKMPAALTINVDAGVLTVTRPSDDKEMRALHGLCRALLNNMVTGVTAGFSKTLLMEGVGYRAQAAGNKLTLNVGFSHPVEIEGKDVTFETPAPTTIVIKGIDKQAVGQVAAEIRSIRKPEPYLGKGIRYENEHIRRKEGKAGKK